MLVAITRDVSPSLSECALTYMDRRPIDVDLAEQQHEVYRQRLREMGADVVSIAPQLELPDAVFVEDTAVVLDEVAVITRPALQSRQPEVASTADALRSYRRLLQIEAPGTMDGGDVLVAGRAIYVGLSERTNRDAADQMARLLHPYGYTVQPVHFSGCLHLKTACTAIGPDSLLINTRYVDPACFPGLRPVEVPGSEPDAGNALSIGNTVLLPASFPETHGRIEAAGFSVKSVDVSELQKAEAGVTCCSILLHVE